MPDYVNDGIAGDFKNGKLVVLDLGLVLPTSFDRENYVDALGVFSRQQLSYRENYQKLVDQELDHDSFDVANERLLSQFVGLGEAYDTLYTIRMQACADVLVYFGSLFQMALDADLEQRFDLVTTNGEDWKTYAEKSKGKRNLIYISEPTALAASLTNDLHPRLSVGGWTVTKLRELEGVQGWVERYFGHFGEREQFFLPTLVVLVDKDDSSNALKLHQLAIDESEISIESFLRESTII